uniref:Snurportin-1 n=2 Tax=Culex tarsalis TaxID=7177 RepID=A0A1Q3G3A5_CULTA
MTDSDSDSVSRFTDLYKNKSRKEEQQSERRRTLLEEQKFFRQSELDAGRPGLLELIEAEQSTDSDSNCSDAVRRPRIWYSKLYRDKVQLSEWMYERPDDLDSWFMVPCPAGTRCLVVIRKGRAIAYDKEGRSITRFVTGLGKRGQQRVTVLDCFLVKEARTFYALDILVYNEMDLVHCDCQFRFLWLRSKMEEDDLRNKFCPLKQATWKLELLPTYDFKVPAQIVDCLSRYPAFPEAKLDGLLFYHKESNYIYGRTPLVTWLFPFMVPDVLGEEWRQALNPRYLASVPAGYGLGPRAFMDEFDAKLAKRRAKRNNNRTTEMEEGGEEEHCGSNGGTGQLDGSYEDENWQQKELDEMRRLEMEG